MSGTKLAMCLGLFPPDTKGLGLVLELWLQQAGSGKKYLCGPCNPRV